MLNLTFTLQIDNGPRYLTNLRSQAEQLLPQVVFGVISYLSYFPQVVFGMFPKGSSGLYKLRIHIWTYM